MQVLGVSPEDPDASRSCTRKRCARSLPAQSRRLPCARANARTKRAKGSARKLLHAGGSRSLSAEALEQAPAAAAPGVRAAPQDASPAAGPAPLQQKAAATFGASTAGGTAMNAPTVPLPAAAQPRAEESGQQPAVAAPEQAAAAAAGAGAAAAALAGGRRGLPGQDEASHRQCHRGGRRRRGPAEERACAQARDRQGHYQRGVDPIRVFCQFLFLDLCAHVCASPGKLGRATAVLPFWASSVTAPCLVI